MGAQESAEGVQEWEEVRGIAGVGWVEEGGKEGWEDEAVDCG